MLSKQQEKQLKKLISSLPVKRNFEGDAERFLLEYISFEAISRKLWHYYRCRNRSKSLSESKASIPIGEVKKAFGYFGVEFNGEDIDTLLLSSKDKRNNKSARNLRNGIVHAWNDKDVKEAVSRKAEFHIIITNILSSVESKLK